MTSTAHGKHARNTFRLGKFSVPTSPRLAVGVVALALGALVAAASITADTVAGFTDKANVSIGDSKNGTISTAKFGIGVLQNGRILHPTDDENVLLNFDYPSALYPGRSAYVDVTIFNNSQDLAAHPRISIEHAGAVEGHKDISSRLRFTVLDFVTGETFGGVQVPLADVNAELRALAARGSAPLRPGQTYVEGDPGSKIRIGIRAHFPDDPTVSEANGGQALLRFVVSATS